MVRCAHEPKAPFSTTLLSEHLQVKQIVGSTLTDANCAVDSPSSGAVATNFATTKPAAQFATQYRDDRLSGGHVIMLGPGNDEAACAALAAFPGGLQVGGGITAESAKRWLDAGASHVIVTSYVFTDGRVDRARLAELVAVVGRERLVLDLSCRRQPGSADGPYFVVTDKWQKYTDVQVNAETLRELAASCDEFLVHGVENEGKRCGILEDLVELLGDSSPIPVTYAGTSAACSCAQRMLAGKPDYSAACLRCRRREHSVRPGSGQAAR